MIFFTSDHHFFHKQVIKYCNRPYDSEPKMRKDLISRHNQIVRKDDTVYFVGDVAMLGASQWEHLKGIVNSLNGNKHLIFGNHDEFKWQRYLDIGFISVHSALQLTIEEFNLVLAHDPSVYCAIDPKSILLCGHVHTLFRSVKDRLVVNVGVDQWDFTPITIDHIRKELGL